MNDVRHPAGHELQAYHDGELAAEASAHLAAHCEGCEACRARMADLERVDGLLAGIDAPDMPRSVWPGIAVRQRKDAGRLGPAFGFAAAAACAAGLVIGILVGPVQFSAETTTDEVTWTGPSSLLEGGSGSSLLSVYQADAD